MAISFGPLSYTCLLQPLHFIYHFYGRSDLARMVRLKYVSHSDWLTPMEYRVLYRRAPNCKTTTIKLAYMYAFHHIRALDSTLRGSLRATHTCHRNLCPFPPLKSPDDANFCTIQWRASCVVARRLCETPKPGWPLSGTLFCLW